MGAKRAGLGCNPARSERDTEGIRKLRQGGWSLRCAQPKQPSTREVVQVIEDKLERRGKRCRRRFFCTCTRITIDSTEKRECDMQVCGGYPATWQIDEKATQDLGQFCADLIRRPECEEEPLFCLHAQMIALKLLPAG